MTALFEERKIGLEELQVILGGFIQVMEAMSEYLLNPCQLILEPEYIYLDAEKNNVRFCYMPGFHGEIQKQFQNLAEYLFQNWIMKMEKRLCWDIMYTDVHWRTAFIWNISRKSYIKSNSDGQEDFEAYEKKKATVVQEEKG